MGIRFGADYYPEHWPESRWETDATLMREMGLKVVRLAEFSWAKMEPREGVFDFDWLERAIALLDRNGIKAVLGTPSATPPAWIIERNPEILPVDSHGVRRGFGGRHHDCQSNAVYRAHITRFVTAMAERFRDNPGVIGWQTDNEFGNSHNDLCHCDSCRAAFQSWLEKKYGTIQGLNDAWGTYFWSQTYDAFRQVPTPMVTPNGHSPSHLLDWKRFHSDLIVDFQQHQIDILRKVCTNQFITHNLMGFFDLVNYYDLCAPLDFVSHDQYPMGFFDRPQPAKTPDVLAATLDHMRGILKKPFWIMEQLAGPTGWEIFGRTPAPGQMALWAAQSVAHGADTVVFFRWRTCTVGTEEYWHGILPHSGKPGRRYRELQSLILQLSPVMDEMAGAMPKAEAAILYSYDQNWAMQIQPHHPDLNYTKQLQRYYKPLFDRQIPVDFVGDHMDLSGYRLVIAPLQYLMNPAREQKFKDFVAGGGKLVLTMRTGVKNDDNVCMSHRELPGDLGDLLGIEICDYNCLRDMTMPVKLTDGSGAIGMAASAAGAPAAGGATSSLSDETAEGPAGASLLWNDLVTPVGAKTLATYGEGWYADTAAVTEMAAMSGGGKAWYVGFEPDEALADVLVGRFAADAGLASVGEAPDGVELCERHKDGRTWIFALNHTAAERRIAPKAGWKAVVGGETLAPYGYAVFEA